MNTSIDHNNGSKASIFSIGWGTALALVILAWAVAIVLRGGQEKVEIQDWTRGLEQAKAVAVEQDKPMLVMFTADWCGPCQVFKRDVLHTPEIKAKIDASFVPVFADLTERSESNPDFVAAMHRYNVSGIPTLMAMTADGKVLAREGKDDMSKAGFDAWLDRVPK